MNDYVCKKPLNSKLALIKQLEQSIHNLKKFPIGIKSIDDENDQKRKRLETLLEKEISLLNISKKKLKGMNL